MADPTFAAQMLAKYQQLLLDNAGSTMVTVDGQTVQFADLEAKYRYWQGQVNRENGTRPRAAKINLGGF
jgi:hypothetical protein